MDKEQKIRTYNCSLKHATEFDQDCLNYINYLIENYNSENLHVITEKYRNYKSMNTLKK